MKAEIKEIWMDEDGAELDDFEKSCDRSTVYAVVHVEIGIGGDVGADTFDFVVCTPSGLAKQLAHENPLSGRHHIILDSFDAQKIRSFIGEICKNSKGGSWPEIAEKIARHGAWEFEDYQS
jgi:hypothetical protein